MKRTIKLAVVAALALGATSAFATNGSNLIGMGVKTRSMGGAGIGVSHGAESGLTNPALITGIKSDNEISFGGTLFMPDVKNDNGLMGMGAGGSDDSGSGDSDADMSIIPEISIVSKVNDNFYFGIGMWGTAGMGVDYEGSGQMEMSTNLQLMQFGVPLAYTSNGFSIGVTPIVQYGSLDIDYQAPVNAGGAAYGEGVAQDLKLGYNIGIAYEISNFTVGAVYKSQIDMEYDDQLSGAMQTFGIIDYDNDELSTPEEIGMGISYNMREHTFAVDYKRINWSDAEGYKDFEWEDQDVYIFGYEYDTGVWAVRLGYNYAESPIEEQSGFAGSTTAPGSNLINTFNLLGFPGIVESHYTIGGSYAFSEKISMDLGFVYAPEVEETFTNFANQDITTKHSQRSVSLGINYNF